MTPSLTPLTDGSAFSPCWWTISHGLDTSPAYVFSQDINSDDQIGVLEVLDMGVVLMTMFLWSMAGVTIKRIRVKNLSPYSSVSIENLNFRCS